MSQLLSQINSPEDVRRLKSEDLPRLAEEVRRMIVDVVSQRDGHLASNLGAVELTLALHYCFDFSKDRLVWDVGHQVYAHKIITGRRDRFHSLRTQGGISGFPDPKESPYDTFITGHAGTAISTVAGLAAGYALSDERRHAVAVVGDGALAAGMAFEALNHAGSTDCNMLIVLNDNRMSISRTVGAFANYLSAVRAGPLYTELKKEVHHLLSLIPVFGGRMEEILEHVKEAVKRSMSPGRMFEEFGFNYFGPVDGHDVAALIEILREIRQLDGPVLLHAITEKGKGFLPALEDPREFHSSKPFRVCDGEVVREPKPGDRPSYTNVFSETLVRIARDDDRIAAVTAAMPDGTGLAPFADEFPARFFDVGICEQHALGLCTGLSTSGLKPVAAIYSTFLQRAYDQLFHELCLQRADVVLAIDRAGLVGSDGPTHHGVFDVAYLRHLPGMTVMAPRDGVELRQMLWLAARTSGPVAIRYPRCPVPDENLDEARQPFGIGECEVMRRGEDIALVAYGAAVYPAAEAARRLADDGIEAAVINARFAKPLDADTILPIIERSPAVITTEDHALSGGFGSALLEEAAARGVRMPPVACMGIPDQFVEHGARDDLLAQFGLDPNGIAAQARRLLGSSRSTSECSSNDEAC